MLQVLNGQEAYGEVLGLAHPELRRPTYNLMPTTALPSFKSAARAGLESRRLLVLAVLAAQPGPKLPAEMLQPICKLAELVL